MSKANETTALEAVITDQSQSSLLHDPPPDDIPKIDSDTLVKHVLNFDFSIRTRVVCLEQLYRCIGSETIEVVSKITGMYQFSGTSILQKFLIQICLPSTQVPNIIKTESAKALLAFTEPEEDVASDDDDELKTITDESNSAVRARNKIRLDIGHESLNLVYTQLQSDESFPTPCLVQLIFLLMHEVKYKDQCDSYFRSVIGNTKLEIAFRYKIILDLERIDVPCKIEYIQNAMNDLSRDRHNVPPRFRILSVQYLLQHCSVKDKYQKFNILLQIAQGLKNDYNTRADSADTLLKFGTEKYKRLAREEINKLAYDDARFQPRNIYNNAQNVHQVDVEDSIGILLETILQIDTQTTEDGNEIVFEHVRTMILKDERVSINGVNGFDNGKITVALNRIEIDRALYSKFKSNLSTILIKVWSHIQCSAYRETLVTRLLEELEEMAETCSSGFVSRLANTLSGFNGMNIKISFTSQIIANFTGRLNAHARRITDKDSPFRNKRLEEVKRLHAHVSPDDADIVMTTDQYVEDFEAQVINEMMLDPIQFNKRRSFLMFFGQYVSVIREELFEEFAGLVTDSDFDLSFRKAISSYEGVSV